MRDLFEHKSENDLIKRDIGKQVMRTACLFLLELALHQLLNPFFGLSFAMALSWLFGRSGQSGRSVPSPLHSAPGQSGRGVLFFPPSWMCRLLLLVGKRKRKCPAAAGMHTMWHREEASLPGARSLLKPRDGQLNFTIIN